MKLLHGFHWLVAAALAALLPVTARTAAGHGMGGNMGMTPHFSSGRGFGHGEGRFGGRDFGRFRRDRFIDRGDRFFDRRDRFFDRRDRGDRFFDRRDRFFDRDDRFFFRHHDRFFFAFDFAAFGFPWWYPYPYPYLYPYAYSYYGYPYGYSSNDYGPGYDYRYWNALAVSVQSELARRGYYHGAIDGVIGSGSSQAIRGFQAAQGLPVTGRIDPKLLKALGVSYSKA